MGRSTARQGAATPAASRAASRRRAGPAGVDRRRAAARGRDHLRAGWAAPAAPVRLGLPVERGRDVVREQVARGQRREPVAVADHLQDRLEPVDRVVDVAARARTARRRPPGSGTPSGRSRSRGSARAQVRHAWRHNVVEEPAPLVVHDEQRAALVLRRLDERVHDVGDERLADPHVAVRVLVARGPLVLAVERGIDERQRRQGAARRLLVVLWTWLERASPARPTAPRRGCRCRSSGSRPRPCESAAKIVVSGNPARAGAAASCPSSRRTGRRACTRGSDTWTPAASRRSGRTR